MLINSLNSYAKIYNFIEHQLTNQVHHITLLSDWWNHRLHHPVATNPPPLPRRGVPIALLYRLWKFPSLAREGWRAAPGWFDRGDSTTQIGSLYSYLTEPISDQHHD